MEQAEQWRDVVGFGGRYQVSDHGRVLNTIRGTYLTGTMTKGGVVVCLRRTDDGATTRLLHVMVSIAFRGPTPEGHCVQHVSEDKRDNRLENLAWRERKRVGSSRKHSVGKLTESDVRHIRELRQKGVSFSLLAESYGVAVSTVYAAAVGRTWKHIA